MNLVIGFGNALRGDDGVGLAVAERVRGLAPAGARVLACEHVPPDLFDWWDAGAEVVLVDAARSGAAPGTVHRFDACAAPLPGELLRVSTHTGGVAEAVELARALGSLPRRLVVYGVEGAAFDPGAGLSPPVAGAVDEVVGRVVGELCTRAG